MRWRTAAALALILSASAGTPQVHHPPAAAAPDPGQEEQALDSALRLLAPQRPGTVDAYVLVIALDSDPVFGREARAAGEVLERRFDARRRSIVLAGTADQADRPAPRGSPDSLSRAMARIAELMDEQEDVLVLYSTSHGTPLGLTYRDGDRETASVTPKQMRALLDRNGIKNRLLILSACFSGIFIPGLQSSNSVILTAASRNRTSFGCVADNDWTFFGDALINRALRKPQSLGAAYAEATNLVSDWERRFEVTPSQPQIFLGAASARWLAPLEQRMPMAATQPVGRPAAETAAEILSRP
ncbi:MAG TPA: C13 family peptidase [Allosphingosinicella sp.]|nr:C13 family peptidase [Allosphingosinicella sp.]